MRRRDFLGILGSAVASWPLAARSQQRTASVIGILDTAPPEATKGNMAEFRGGLKEAGYEQGRDFTIEYRWANNPRELRAGATDLVRKGVAVIVAAGAFKSPRAAMSATSTIPIVLTGGSDPVADGLVASLSRPGGNVTGVSSIHNELAGKRLSLLLDLVPQVKTIGYLAGHQLAASEKKAADEVKEGAHLEGREVIILECNAVRDFETAFAALVARHAGALIVSAFPLAFNNRPKIVALAAQHKLPTIYSQSQYVYEGGLISYSASGLLRQAAVQYVARILKGAKPADLPVQLPTEFKLIINLKTANALGLEVSPTLHVIANEIIE
jgi:putative ABC transport system substrate-binding protein